VFDVSRTIRVVERFPATPAPSRVDARLVFRFPANPPAPPDLSPPFMNGPINDLVDNQRKIPLICCKLILSEKSFA
jgi:hypothetical protein